MRIKDKKTAHALVRDARTALDALGTAQRELFEWGDAQNLSEADYPGDELWNAVAAVGDSVDSIDRPLVAYTGHPDTTMASVSPEELGTALPRVVWAFDIDERKKWLEEGESA